MYVHEYCMNLDAEKQRLHVQITDPKNSRCQTLPPPPDFKRFFHFRKVDKSNKTVKPDLKKSCENFSSALVKGNRWITKPHWLEFAGGIRALSNAIHLLQVGTSDVVLLHCFHGLVLWI